MTSRDAELSELKLLWTDSSGARWEMRIWRRAGEQIAPLWGDPQGSA